MDFDTTLLTVVTSQLEILAGKIKKHSQSVSQEIEKSVASIKNIQQNESLKEKYSQIYNSCLVLLVAYFGETLKELFIYRLQQKIEKGDKIFESEKLKLNFEEIKIYNFNLKSHIARIITDSLKISFQDMQSTGRCFKDYIGYDIERDKRQSNIIVAQALRHVIVHADSKINKEYLNQVRVIQKCRLACRCKELRFNIINKMRYGTSHKRNVSVYQKFGKQNNSKSLKCKKEEML